MTWIIVLLVMIFLAVGNCQTKQDQQSKLTEELIEATATPAFLAARNAAKTRAKQEAFAGRVLMFFAVSGLIYYLFWYLPAHAEELSVAQYATSPTITGHSEYGAATRLRDGTILHTAPNVFGHPEYGVTTTGPGVRCTSRDIIFGKPNYGQCTDCK